ncbi:MAG: hypothetical protein A2Z03_12425 [Chloroflexi bacterium RBG_16_56_8]|nr:MAG: hypothetical protein A2Z03_12425 [Chloroflexi bacterium RBG_16_56_8]
MTQTATPLLDAIGSLKKRIMSSMADVPTEVWMSETTRDVVMAEAMQLMPEDERDEVAELLTVDGMRIIINNTFADGLFALSAEKPIIKGEPEGIPDQKPLYFNGMAVVPTMAQSF